MGVLIATLQQLALLAALALWALAAGYLFQTAAAWWGVFNNHGTLRQIRTSIAVLRAFWTAVFVWSGFLLLSVRALLPEVLS